MYTDFYNFKEKPFNLTPSSRFLYLGDVHKEALALLTYGVVERKGFILLTGEVGAGKTTMIHALLEGLDTNIQYVYLSNPLFSVKDFFNRFKSSVLVARDFGISWISFSTSNFFDRTSCSALSLSYTVRAMSLPL